MKLNMTLDPYKSDIHHSAKKTMVPLLNIKKSVKKTVTLATAKIGQLQIELQGNKVNRQLQVLKISEQFSYVFLIMLWT